MHIAMIRSIYIKVALLMSQNLFGQTNLIPNPGFELYSTCPTATAQVNNLLNWTQLKESPDYYNSCTSTPQVSVPSNLVGYQPALGGNGYCGMFCYHSSANGREYLGTQFIASLVSGQKYFISFHLSLSGGVGYTKACNKFGCKLSTVPFIYNALIPDNMVLYHTDSIITDTINWVFIKGSFIADSAYNYIALGNFFNDSNTDTINVSGNTSLHSYYYLDNVCLTIDSTLCNDITNLEENQELSRHTLIVKPNPSAGEFYAKSEIKISAIDIFDINGKKIDAAIEDISGTSKYFKIRIHREQNGVYYMQFLIESKIFFKKIIIY